MNKQEAIAAYLKAHRPPKNGMRPEEALAANVLWRDKAPLTSIARAFGVARNTLYYKIIAGDAPSYPKTASNWAAATNDLVEKVGVEEIRRRFVTKAMLDAVWHG